MEKVTKRLFELSDKKYAAFEAKLCPTLSKECFIGVRVPDLRQFAKELKKSGDSETFLNELPHGYYDENLLHSILVSDIKDFESSIKKVEAFLPYINNWASCDTLHPKAFAKEKEKLLPYVKKWITSNETYVCRFGIDILMTYYLDDDFKPEYLDLPLKADNDDYYVKMMSAWYYATALAKHWGETIPYIENKTLDRWTHNKTIQKCIESYRITDKQKEYLRQLKIQKGE